MATKKTAHDFWLKLRSGIGSVFKGAPVSSSVILLMLLFAAGIVVQLAIKGSQMVWPAFFPLAAALVVIFDNLRSRSAENPIPWPRWLTILVLVNMVVGVASCWTILLELLNLPFKGIRTASFQLTVLVLILILLPRLLMLVNRGLGFIPRFASTLTRRFTAPVLYLLFLISWISICAVYILSNNSSDDILVYSVLFVTACGLAFWLRSSLWWTMPQYSLLARALPHIPAWYLLVAVSMYAARDLLPTWGLYMWDEVYVLMPFPLALIVWGYWLLQRLRRSPVTVLTEQRSDRADSIQSKVDHYMDVHGLSSRLTASVERSDGGVFGVTGVRGAGKSALTRHVLSRLDPSYFTLEVTAPVRHDQDMGFFTALCRAVCRKTLDDLEPILYGARGGAGGKLWGKIRNSTLVLIAAIAGVSLWVVMQEGSFQVKSRRIIDESVSLSAFKRDPLLGYVPRKESIRLEAERRVVDQLISQIAQVIVEGDSDDAQRYLLVPSSSRRSKTRFWLLRQAPKSDPHTSLLAYRHRLDEVGVSLSPPVFLFQMLDSYEQYRWLQEIETSSVYTENISEIELKEWKKESQFENLAKSSLVPPLSHLIHELHFHLCSPSESTPGPQFVSSLILKAFVDSDPRLSFDVARLRQFQEALQVYRYLLDGDVIPPPLKEGENQPGLQKVSMSDRLYNMTETEVMVFWSAIGAILLLLFAGPLWSGISNLARALVNRRYLELYAKAESFMEQLTFQSSRETSAGLSLRGVSLGRKQTLATRDLTLPGLTARYIGFLNKVRSAYNGKIVIAIDELDKVHDPEQVKALLVEIKGALFSPGTFYIVSISEDAARSFRSRLASGRDIFESTFDDVLDIGRIDVDAAVSILTRMELTGDAESRLPPNCLEVAAMFGGGIPREIIRARRTLSFAMKEQADATSAWAARILMKEELQKWETHLGEANLSGADTIQIRQYSRVASGALEDGSDSTETYSSMWDVLEPCIQIIDPEQLRKSVGYLAKDNAPSSDPIDVQQAGYKRIANDLQKVMRLLILVHSCELILWPGKSRESYENHLLECHRALADKPALAETLLHELRETPVTGV